MTARGAHAVTVTVGAVVPDWQLAYATRGANSSPDFPNEEESSA